MPCDISLIFQHFVTLQPHILLGSYMTELLKCVCSMKFRFTVTSDGLSVDLVCFCAKRALLHHLLQNIKSSAGCSIKVWLKKKITRLLSPHFSIIKVLVAGIHPLLSPSIFLVSKELMLEHFCHFFLQGSHASCQSFFFLPEILQVFLLFLWSGYDSRLLG